MLAAADGDHSVQDRTEADAAQLVAADHVAHTETREAAAHALSAADQNQLAAQHQLLFAKLRLAYKANHM